jgi:serine/threonine-protein kinase HipA
MECPIEIFAEGAWVRIGTWIPDASTLGRGIAGPGRWAYEVDWVVNHLDTPWATVSLALPMGLDSVRLEHWPSFLVDLLPTGPARDRWLELLGLRNGPGADWPLLLHAGRAPVGNLRLAHARDWKPEAVRGFTREEVVEHRGEFLEFMRESQQQRFGLRNDSPYSAADTQGAAPKYLLTRDREGLWWAEGTLPDEFCHSFWLAKLPRGRTEIDRTILEAERSIVEIARDWGLRCPEPLDWEPDILFVPRFDRETGPRGVVRHGLETLCSAMGSAEFGARFSHEEICAAIAKHSTSPADDLLEYVGRDVLNLALANSDNHARNTSFLKKGPEVRLSPLYDAAPMELDPEGIPRSSRWNGESHLRPDWGRVADALAPHVDRNRLISHLHGLAARVRSLPASVRTQKLPSPVLDRCDGRWERLASDLESVA